MPRRHLIIPDTQVRPDIDTRHIDWAAAAIVDYRPDVVVVMGDWWDMPSLSSHNPPGSSEAEGKRIRKDIDAGNEAFARLVAPMRRARMKPECHFLMGNHEHRITRTLDVEPRLAGVISLGMLETQGFQRHPFLKIVTIDGIRYSHYFPNPFSGNPIGGTIVNRLGHIGGSFVQGHQQGFSYAMKQYPDHVSHGIVCGRFYVHDESYRPQDVQRSEWSGILVLNGVRDGDFDLMPLRIDYLRTKYGANQCRQPRRRPLPKSSPTSAKRGSTSSAKGSAASFSRPTKRRRPPRSSRPR